MFSQRRCKENYNVELKNLQTDSHYKFNMPSQEILCNISKCGVALRKWALKKNHVTCGL